MNYSHDLINELITTHFPTAQSYIGDNFFYIQAGKLLGDAIHYEFINGELYLHIESKDSRWWQLRNYLREHLSTDNRVTPLKWCHGRNAGRWRLNNFNSTEWEQIKCGFVKMREIFEPLISNWEKRFTSNNATLLDNSNVATNAPEVEAHKKSIADIISLNNLNIPDYQRPYCWTPKNVEQLLNDINLSRISGHIEYLIGSAIFHSDNSDCVPQLNIVDGQQRITTLCLILLCLDSDFKIPSLNFYHTESCDNILRNKKFIDSWIDINLNISDKDAFKDFILNNCLMIEVTVHRLNEAFQLFETQNSRGKKLEAYNLLKAYHIRAMDDYEQTDKIKCDVRWEDAAIFIDRNNVKHDLLLQLINEHLYRTRVWSRGDDAQQFSIKNIDEFKGFSLNKTSRPQFPFQNAMIYQEFAETIMKTFNRGFFNLKSRFEHGDPDNISPFLSVNQPIVNGKAFFDYIETFVEIYKRIFLSPSSSQLNDFKEFYNEYCLYSGANRIGDTYIRQIYKSAIILLFDRFGEKGVNEFFKPVYICFYRHRLEKEQVKYNTMTSSTASGKIFTIIQHAKNISELSELKIKAEEYRTSCKVNFKNAPKVEQLIKTHI